MNAILIKSALGRAITGAARGTGLIHAQKFPPEFLVGAESGSLAKKLYRTKINATPAVITQRRTQIPPEVFREVFTRFNASSVYGRPQRGYNGHRVLAGEGTAINIGA